MKAAFIRSTTLIGFPEFIRSLGGDPISLLREVGINPDIVEREDSILAYNKMVVLYELAAKELKQPYLGLKRALFLPPHFSSIGTVAYISFFEKTARSWVDAAQKYQRLYTDGQSLELIEKLQTGDAIIRIHTSAVSFVPRQIIEFQMAAYCLLAKEVLKVPEAGPRITRFRHPEPENTQLHEQIFGGKVEFGAEHDEFVFDIGLLGTKLNGPGRYLRPMINMYMQYRMKKTPKLEMSMRETLSLFLQSALGIGKCNLESAAQALLLNEKKLQRLLADEGTSFSEVLDNVRRKKAISLLKNPGLKIKIIAGNLEYTNTAAFTLAFNRWTGMSPIAYRKVLEENGELMPPH